jgi:penicillin-binding protein 2
MVAKYDISDDYTDEEKRIVAGIRYEMFIRNFSVANRYTFAQDIPMDAVVRLKEASYDMDGIDVIEEAIRVYEQGDVIPHLIGTVGPIDAEEYEKYKSEGYALNDVIGKAALKKLWSSIFVQKGTRTIGFLMHSCF